VRDPGLLGLGQGRAPRVAVPVPAVRAGDQVFVAQRRHRPHRDRFLSRVQVRSALDDIAPQQVIDPIFKHSDLPHLPQQIERLLFAQAFLFQIDMLCHALSFVIISRPAPPV
jgi:hypothetical protein